jgi:site-specific recombinase XerD
METKGEEDMEAMLEKVTRSGALAVEDLARRIAKEAPNLSDLSPEALEKLANAVLGQRLARDLDRKADIAGIDYQAERETFLDTAGRAKSPNTRKAYAAALARLEDFAARRGIAVLAMKAKNADDFAYSLAAEGRAPASVRLDLAAASSFYTFLERRSDGRVSNPLRGSKARPAAHSRRAAAYPSKKEVAEIMAALEPEDRAAASVMLFRGLRVGALPSLTIRAGRFAARSKGKDISGELPEEALAAIRSAGLNSRAPFSLTTETKLADAIRRKTKKLTEAGKIAAPYSAHDFRHFYAVEEYRKDKDIYRVSKLLGHASILITERYLKGLGEVD